MPAVPGVVHPVVKRHPAAVADEERGPHDGLISINHVVVEGHLGVVPVHLGEVCALEQLGEEANELFTFGRRPLGPMLPEGPLRRLAKVEDVVGDLVDRGVALVDLGIALQLWVREDLTTRSTPSRS